MSIGFEAAREAGLEIGILRAERALHRPADVRAALADPAAPDGIRRILECPAGKAASAATATGARSSKAGGRGLEPRFPGPKPGVLAGWTTPQRLVTALWRGRI